MIHALHCVNMGDFYGCLLGTWIHTFFEEELPIQFYLSEFIKNVLHNGRDIIFFLQKFKTYIYLQFVTDGFDE